MRNNGRYTLCPFYIDEKKLTISCEDVYRRFRWASQKYEWMDEYCDRDWQSCPYAAALLEMYKRIEEGDDMAHEEHNLQAVRAELHKVSTQLGRAEKRNEAKDEEIRRLRAKNHKLEDLRMEMYRDLRRVKNELDRKDERIQDELSRLQGIYEDRLAYLISMYCPDGKLFEADVKAWREGVEYSLVQDESEEDRVWTVELEEERVANGILPPSPEE